MENAGNQSTKSVCYSCQVGIKLSADKSQLFYENPTTTDEFAEVSELFKPMLLTDCCSLFSSILRMQPNAQERCSRIIMAHLRDLQSLLSISFADASTNLGDVGTKHGGNNNILQKFMKTGRFTISFVGRKERKIGGNETNVS